MFNERDINGTALCLGQIEFAAESGVLGRQLFRFATPLVDFFFQDKDCKTQKNVKNGRPPFRGVSAG
jgi:hypothetical protein